MKECHHRMSVIVSKKDIDDWITPDSKIDRFEEIMKPYDSDKMKVYTVSSAIIDKTDDCSTTE